ncbi:MAG: MBOAT family protein [Nitrospirae bacterium]|nr:MBOAT family protein [Nitrospirota bacterium]
MLFNSYEFIFLFLPLTLVGAIYLGRRREPWLVTAWLNAASLFFYGWWNPSYLWLIVASIAVNYLIGRRLLKDGAGLSEKKWTLAAGIAVNLTLLGYFKYANFFVENWRALAGSELQPVPIILPIAISFFTFTQIAYLVDAYRGEAQDNNFLRYSLFVTFFPHLIAGPIVHHRELIPQFARKGLCRFRTKAVAVGVTIFVIGLFKKVVLADGVAQYSTPVFEAARDGVVLSFIDAWGGALAYTFQLYFDFSGYSDMAIGLARMFNVRLPINFNSPYKAVNVIEFWRRWHMTLSRFFREYLYIPLGGNRRGIGRHYANLLGTMLLVGLWHGAGWTFIVWGGLHGVYLLINHAWRRLRQCMGQDLQRSSLYGRGMARLVTFAAVVIGWVFFRAEDCDVAMHMLHSMLGLNGLSLPEFFSGRIGMVEGWLLGQGIRFDGLFDSEIVDWDMGLKWLGILLLMSWYAPNTQELMRRFRPAINIYQAEVANSGWAWLSWKPTPVWALAGSILALWGILSLTQMSEFLYFRF